MESEVAGRSTNGLQRQNRSVSCCKRVGRLACDFILASAVLSDELVKGEASFLEDSQNSLGKGGADPTCRGRERDMIERVQPSDGELVFKGNLESQPRGLLEVGDRSLQGRAWTACPG